jgi:hypothetical protein
MNATRTSELSEEIKERYQEYLVQVKLPTNHEEKLEYLLESGEMGLGTTVAIFEMLYYFRDVVSEEILR